MRPRSLYGREIWKRSFISAIRPTVRHTLFKSEEFENAGFTFQSGLPFVTRCFFFFARGGRKYFASGHNKDRRQPETVEEKPLAPRVRMDEKHFENGAFRKRWRHDNHVISLPEFSWDRNGNWPMTFALSNFSGVEWTENICCVFRCLRRNVYGVLHGIVCVAADSFPFSGRAEIEQANEKRASEGARLGWAKKLGTRREGVGTLSQFSSRSRAFGKGKEKAATQDIHGTVLFPVDRRLDNALFPRINHYPVHKWEKNKPCHPLDSDLSGGYW